MNIDLSQIESATETLKAIAHPTRIAMVGLLDNGAELSVTEIYEALQIEQAVASHHLSILKNKDVLEVNRVGKNCFYKLKYPQLSQILTCIATCHKK
ncbi:MAG: helix-turn-helix transcriptional regulator [Flavobacteriales bacterium]|nr:helix-turn-helix transcriptional regulator [Flavobacteriales bacterium]